MARASAEPLVLGAGLLLAQSDAQQAVLVADTLDGDELVFHRRAPDPLLVLPRETEAVVLASLVLEPMRTSLPLGSSVLGLAEVGFGSAEQRAESRVTSSAAMPRR